MSTPTPTPSGTGIWSSALRYGDRAAAAEAAVELEGLGYDAIWLPDVGGDLLERMGELLDATDSMTVASGILNIWFHEPQDVAAAHRRFVEAHGDRVLIALGVSHGPLIDQKAQGTYRRPLTRMVEFLDGLDAADPPLPTSARAIGALGPKMVALAGERTAGTHPYLGSPELTHRSRDALGPDAYLAPEQAVVLETDPDRARRIARSHLATYLGLPNYANSWRRMGWTDADIADGGSDALVDHLVVWGDEERIAARVQEHRDAGADHVCVQVVTDDPMTAPLDPWRRLAPALT